MLGCRGFEELAGLSCFVELEQAPNRVREMMWASGARGQELLCHPDDPSRLAAPEGKEELAFAATGRVACSVAPSAGHKRWGLPGDGKEDIKAFLV